MDNGIRTIYPIRLNKVSMFRGGSRVLHKTPEERWATHEPKRCEYNNKKEDNNSNFYH